MSKFGDLYDKLHGKDWITWVGHGVQGVLIFYILLWATGSDVAAGMGVLMAFLHREISDLLGAYRKGGKRAFAEKLPDSTLDFMVPLVAVGVVRGLTQLIF